MALADSSESVTRQENRLIRSFSKTDVGKKRKTNQDCVFTQERPIGNLPNLFVVADGMGGHRAGDYASRVTIENVVSAITVDTETDPVQLMKKAIRTANAELVSQASQNREYAGMGTTLVCCTIRGSYAYIASIGDSRLYIINQGIKQVTRDHSLVQEMVRIGEIRPDEAKKHPDRNIITRAIGITAEAVVDFFDLRVSEGDIILMCTDGLTNMVDDDSIFETVQSSRDIVEMVEELIAQANRNGGKDNIGIVMVQIKNDEVTDLC